MTETWNHRIATAVSRWTSPRRTENGLDVHYRMPPMEEHPAYKSLRKYEMIGGMIGLKSPFFKVVESNSGSHTQVEGRDVLNFSWGDYIGMNRLADQREAAKAAIDQYGTSVCASRMVAGETPLHLELEQEIVDFINVDAALVFVSAHAANVSTIGTLMSEDDLIIHDEFVHNSAVMGMRLSRAAVKPFRHNDLDHLETLLREHRGDYKRVLILVEGLYSTEGDICDLSGVIDLKEQYGAWLMVDDAHGFGVLGNTGRGIMEHCDIDPKRVDIWMGTMSKALASCGGFIAGSKTLIEILKHTAPGFVFSVGMAPPMAAGALHSLRTLRAEPERMTKLHDNSAYFLKLCQDAGLNTGSAEGLGMVPVIAGDVIKAMRLWHRVFERGINPSLIVYPGVPMKAGRLRFFLSAMHTKEELDLAVKITKEELAKL